MKLSHRIVIALPMLFLVLPASGHETGAVHDHGVSGLLLLAVLVSGMAAVLRAGHKPARSPRPSSAPSRSKPSSRTRRSSPTFSRPPRCQAKSSFVRSKPV